MNLRTVLTLFFFVFLAGLAVCTINDFKLFAQLIQFDDVMAVANPLLWDTISMKAKHLGEKALQEDEVVNVDAERERCNRYGFEYDNRTTRRRVFMGSLIAEDSWWPLHAIATVGYGIYHTVAFVEANCTQSSFPRAIRFPSGSANLQRLQSGIFGPKTAVSVDVTVLPTDETIDPLTREHIQREAIVDRWKWNGMRDDDIGIVVDTDETFT